MESLADSAAVCAVCAAVALLAALVALVEALLAEVDALLAEVDALLAEVEAAEAELAALVSEVEAALADALAALAELVAEDAELVAELAELVAEVADELALLAEAAAAEAEAAAAAASEAALLMAVTVMVVSGLPVLELNDKTLLALAVLVGRVMLIVVGSVTGALIDLTLASEFCWVKMVRLSSSVFRLLAKRSPPVTKSVVRWIVLAPTMVMLSVPAVATRVTEPVPLVLMVTV